MYLALYLAIKQSVKIIKSIVFHYRKDHKHRFILSINKSKHKSRYMKNILSKVLIKKLYNKELDLLTVYIHSTNIFNIQYESDELEY